MVFANVLLRLFGEKNTEMVDFLINFNIVFPGWEENKNVVAKKIRQEAKMRRKKGKKAAAAL